MYSAKKHFETLFEICPQEFSFRASSKKELSVWQEKFRSKLREALGLSNMEQDLKDHQPEAEMSGSEDMGSYFRETWHIWVEPTVPLPFYLLRPKNRRGPIPLVLTPHGHSRPHLYVGIALNREEEESSKNGERDVACQAVEEGYLVIAPTTRGFGETRTDEAKEMDEKHSCRIQLMHDLLVGRTPIGDRVWDNSRLLDWALAHEDVDSGRIAITGNSGGGTISLFTAACDTRIRVAVPSCYFCTFQGSIGSINHCDCNYIPGILRLGEMYDVAGLVAPRAFLAVAGKEDHIFPIEHSIEAFERLKNIYRVSGAPDNCRLYIGEEGHRYYKKAVWPFIGSQFR